MMTGKVNTSVLPEPVKAMPIMSRPDRLVREERPEGQARWKTDCFSSSDCSSPRLSGSHSHGGNSLDLNGCWVVDALLLQASQDGYRKQSGFIFVFHRISDTGP